MPQYTADYNAKVMIDGVGYGVDGNWQGEALNSVLAYQMVLIQATTHLHTNHKGSVERMMDIRIDITIKKINQK